MSLHRYSLRSALIALAPLSVLWLAQPVQAAPLVTPREDVMDISASRDKLRAFTDGKGHYIVLIPFDINGPFFYGDGTTFYAQRPFGGGRVGDTAFNRSFWEPRVDSGANSMFQLRDKKYTLSCSTRETTFTPLTDAENAALLAKATFQRARWKHQSYLLARDEQGRYYYVDRAREPEGNKSFRVFVGTKGNLKQLKMTNVVSDSQGDIFSTKTGEIRIVSSSQSAKRLWIHGKTKLELTDVPIEENHMMVYTDLGVYTGERLGTPCDDL